MRKIGGVLPVGLALGTVGLVACTSLLGDFSVGASATSGDGGDDAITSSDGPPAEAGDDASDAPAFKSLTCKESKVDNRVHIATLDYGNSGNGPDRLHMFTHIAQNGPRTTVLVDGVLISDGGGFNNILHAYSFSPQDTSPVVADAPIPGVSLLAADRYATGLAALVVNRQTGQAFVYKLPDGTPNWEAGHPVTNVGAIPNNTCRLNGSFRMLTPAGDDYLVVFNWVTGANNCQTLDPPVIAGLHAHDVGAIPNLNPWPGAPGSDAGAPQSYDFPAQSISVSGASADVIVDVSYSNGGGPSPGAGPLDYRADVPTMNNPNRAFMKLATPASILYPLATRESATAGKLDTAFIGGQISGPALFVGQIKGSDLQTVTPETALPATAVAKVGDLPVDKGNMHWDFFGGSLPTENLLLVSRGAAGGANFYWFNQLGQPIARQVGADALFGQDTVLGLDANLIQAPIPAYGQLEFALIEAAPDAGANSFAFWGVHVNCD